MQEKGRGLRKIIAATAMVVFALFSVFAGSIAWFNMNRAVSEGSDGFNVAAVSSIHILSAHAIRYDGTAGARATDLLSGEVSITMSEYDYIFRDRNVNTPLFFRLVITGFDTGSDLHVTIPCSGDIYNQGETSVANNLSNVISVKFLTGLEDGKVKDDNDLSTPAGVKASYDGMLARASSGTGTPFVTDSGKVKSITPTLTHATAFANSMLLQAIDESGNSVDAAVVFIEFDYHVTNSVNLVESYVQSYGSDSHEYFFVNDIGTMMLYQ